MIQQDSIYVTVEGIDGCGKTTLVEALGDRMAVENDVVVTREPRDDTWTGEAVREALGRDTAPMTDLFLFYADRAENLRTTVVPALRAGAHVVSDRGADSMFAYQAERLEHFDDPFGRIAAGYEGWDVEPDLTLWLDVPVDVAVERMDGVEKYERRETLENVKRNYERLYDMHEKRFHRIDATRSPDGVLDDAMDAVRGELA